jgi:hypothetical protein
LVDFILTDLNGGAVTEIDKASVVNRASSKASRSYPDQDGSYFTVWNLGYASSKNLGEELPIKLISSSFICTRKVNIW